MKDARASLLRIPIVLIAMLAAGCASGPSPTPTRGKLSPPEWILGVWGNKYDTFTFTRDNVLYQRAGADLEDLSRLDRVIEEKGDVKYVLRCSNGHVYMFEPWKGSAKELGFSPSDEVRVGSTLLHIPKVGAILQKKN